MRFADVIARKRDGQALTRHEIDLFVRGVVDGSVPDYQASALLMAIVLRGMDDGAPFLHRRRRPPVLLEANPSLAIELHEVCVHGGNEKPHVTFRLRTMPSRRRPRQ